MNVRWRHHFMRVNDDAIHFNGDSLVHQKGVCEGFGDGWGSDYSLGMGIGKGVRFGGDGNGDGI